MKKPISPVEFTLVNPPRRWLARAVVAALIFLTFLPVLWNDFVDLDDSWNLVFNPHYRVSVGGTVVMANLDKTAPVTMQEPLISSLAQIDALAKLLIEKGLITRDEFMQKISEERATYQKLFNPTPQ